MLTCTFNGWIILWTKGRVPSKRPLPTFPRNLCLRRGGRLQGTLQYFQTCVSTEAIFRLSYVCLLAPLHIYTWTKKIWEHLLDIVCYRYLANYQSRQLQTQRLVQQNEEIRSKNSTAINTVCPAGLFCSQHAGIHTELTENVLGFYLFVCYSNTNLETASWLIFWSASHAQDDPKMPNQD